MNKGKELRREESIERQEAHDKLTTEQKIEKAKGRRGNSKKELERLRKKKK